MTTAVDDTEYDDNDVTDSDTDTDDWTPPTKEDYQRLVSDHRKASAEAAARKRALQGLGYDKNGNKVTAVDNFAITSGAEPANVDSGAIEKAVAKKYEAIYSGLAQAGVPAGQLGRLARFIDATSVVIDDEGIEGLAEQIDSLKTDYPELFKRSRVKTVDASVAGGGTKQVPATTNADPLKSLIESRIKAGLL